MPPTQRDFVEPCLVLRQGRRQEGDKILLEDNNGRRGADGGGVGRGDGIRRRAPKNTPGSKLFSSKKASNSLPSKTYPGATGSTSCGSNPDEVAISARRKQP